METLKNYENIVNKLFTEHGLLDWKFVWNNRTSNRTWGICIYTSKEIHINKKYALLAPQEDVIDTILHEIAHALTRGDGHGERWKAKCRELGCKDEQFKSLSKKMINKLSRYKGTCPTCGHTIYSGRKTGIVHIQCANNEYHKTGDSNFNNHVYVWSNND